ncbi:MAG: cytochrome P450 [Bdellovibrionia bacterium]
MRKQILIPICVLASVVAVACSTSGVRDLVARDIASFEDARNPETGKTYAEEAAEYGRLYDNAESEFKVDAFWGFYKVDPALKDKKMFDAAFKKMATTLRWVRYNPIAVFKYWRDRADPAKNPAGPWNSNVVLKPIPIQDPSHSNVSTVLVTKYKDVEEAFTARYDSRTGRQLDPQEQVTPANEQFVKHAFTVRNYNRKINESIGADFMLSTDDRHPYNGNLIKWNDPNYGGDEKLWMRQIMGKDDIENVVRPMVRRLVGEAIKEGTFVATNKHDGRDVGRLELVNRIARLVPVRLTQRYFGFNAPEEKLLRWSRAAQFEMFHNVKNDPAVRAESALSGRQMQTFVGELVKQRSRELDANPKAGNDILSRLVRLSKSGKAPGFDDPRVQIQLIGTLVGNVETSEAAIVQSLEVMFQNPQLFEAAKAAALRSDDDKEGLRLLEGYVWEALRMNPVNPFVVRYAETNFVLAKGTPRETNIRKGSVVLLATHSAMLDEDMYPNPEQFDPNRIAKGQPEYYHLGDKYHRCLGDYVSKVQVPEIIRAILRLPGVRPVAGILDKSTGKTVVDPQTGRPATSDKGKMSKEGGIHRDEQAFPERFDIEFDAPSAPPAFQVFDPLFAYEEYLNDYDRTEFRLCMSKLFDLKRAPEESILNIFANIANHKKVDYRSTGLFCRLNKPFRECMEEASKGRYAGLGKRVEGFDRQTWSFRHNEALKKCSAANPLTPTETAFYRHVNFSETLDKESLSLAQADDKGKGWEYEKHLKFYDRFTTRECLMNPAGWASFPDAREMLFYSRLPLGFRMCMGVPAKTMTKELIENGAPEHVAKFKARSFYYPRCKFGELDPVTGKKVGALTEDEQYYYQTMLLVPPTPAPMKK